MPPARHFLTFADSRLTPSLHRIADEARRTGIFNSIATCTERSLDRTFRQRHGAILKPTVRGYGYWIWKPQIILQTLRALPAGDILAYCDVGCRFTQRGRDRLEQYIRHAEASPAGLVGFKYFPPAPPFPYDGRTLFDWRNSQRIKGDLLDYFGLRTITPFLEDYCFAGGVLFCGNTRGCRLFMETWLETMETDIRLIDDSPSRSPNLPEFIEHRHDQAVFNCLAYKFGVPAICGYELQYPGATPDENDWDTIADYPIHARRDKKLSASGRLRTRLHRAWARFRGTA
jgi:hypothetical protein